MNQDKLGQCIRSIDRNIYDVYGTREEPQIIDKEIRRLEERLGFSLPIDMKEYVHQPVNGLLIEAKEKFWPRAGVGDIREFWTHLHGICVLGLGEKLPEECTVWHWLDKVSADGQAGLIPFMNVLNDNHFVYCFDQRGQIQEYFFGEIGCTIAIDFVSLLKKEINELEERRQRLTLGQGLISIP